ncbi:uncharacterized protein METZ01_LOCUS277434 [marine metagenome]|uniref:Uncharacterized protein n=1 Tax=marine metagenome TaxID=408172 RepID=A0A382KJE1_9ZZZZ
MAHHTIIDYRNTTVLELALVHMQTIHYNYNIHYAVSDVL